MPIVYCFSNGVCCNESFLVRLFDQFSNQRVAEIIGIPDRELAEFRRNHQRFESDWLSQLEAFQEK